MSLLCLYVSGVYQLQYILVIAILQCNMYVDIEGVRGILTKNQGANNKRNHRNQRVKKPDYKVAYVQLGQGKTFQFPNLFPEKEDSDTEAFDDFRKKFMEKEQQSQKGDPRRGGVPDWFGL
uniref:39S ribosomal protein L23, mitochondrial n=1 Tax=Coturnix japonica TaxID=93934 RepID=A0A8C2UA92_COTJA